MDRVLLTVSIAHEQDVVLCRQRARQIASLLGFELAEQTRISTAVSEIARNTFRYALGGKASFAITEGSGPTLQIRIQDRGPGIARLQDILAGRYVSSTGMGLGIAGARRLMDSFQIESSPETGTLVVLGKRIPFREESLTPQEISYMAGELAKLAPLDAFSEVRQQNAELAQAMRALQEREEELTAQRNQLHFLNEELADTNRGVVALNKELEEKAEAIKQAGEVKSRFLSHMTHEFRTPLNSILSLSRILLSPDPLDPLSAERQKQIQFIRKSAEQLSEMINDMLDTAKLEAGRLDVQPADVDITELFGSLRAMFRPLLGPERPVELVFELEEAISGFHSDEAKIAQILRNFISNALKFTVKGEIKVRARALDDAKVEFSVSDTGIGIALRDQERIFEEFTQVDSPLQRRSKGTGLGLSLARQLAELLGGSVAVKSEIGVGSTFTALLPLRFVSSAEPTATQIPQVETHSPGNAAAGPSVFVTDHEERVYNKPYIDRDTFQPMASKYLARIRKTLQSGPQVDEKESVSLPGWPCLMEVDPGLSTNGEPKLVISLISDNPIAAAGETRWQVRPVDQIWFLNRFHELICQMLPNRVLIIDDDEIARYLLRDLLKDSGCVVVEAKGGLEGLQRALDDRPQVIFLDLRMQDMSGFEVLASLKNNPLTRSIPVIINSSMRVQLSDFDERFGQPVAILSKEWPQDEVIARIREALCHSGLIGLGLAGE